MSNKSWSFTTYENGKAVATEHNLDNRQALDAIRAAMSGEAPRVVADYSERRELNTAELAHAA